MIMKAIQDMAIRTEKEVLLHMLQPTGIERNTSTGIIQAAQCIMTMDGKYTFK